RQGNGRQYRMRRKNERESGTRCWMECEEVPPMSDRTITCPSNPDHGPLEPRPLERQTPEQKWCGTWFDCTRCSSSVLVPSPELTKFLEEQRRRPQQEVLFR